MNTIKCFTRDGNIKYYRSDEEVLIPSKLKKNKKEFHGVWFSTVENIDFSPFADENDAKKYLIDVVQTCQLYHINAVIFQVRPTNDCLYNSKFNPWSKYLNKNKCEDEWCGFDIFEFFIEECKKVNIEVHAWINPYRVTNTDISKLNLTKDEFLDTLSARNFARINKNLVIETVNHKLILDPSSEVVQEYLVKTSLELANEYDIKAIHIDDYFYPYEEIIDPDEDKKRMMITPYLDKASFRRFNVNEMIRKLHESLKTANKKVELGISPFSVYRTNSRIFEEDGKQGGWYRGSNNYSGAFQCYDGLYSDVFLWMKEGWIDYVCPQDYFALDNYKKLDDGKIMETVKYADILRFWANLSKETKTRLYIGMAMYKVGEEGVWQNDEEIIDELKLNQTYKNVLGSVFFTYSSLKNGKNEVAINSLKKLKNVWK